MPFQKHIILPLVGVKNISYAKKKTSKEINSGDKG
jgi:hypothetical protein